jgi:hypothetical protein
MRSGLDVAVVAPAQIFPQRNALSNFLVRIAVYFGCLEPLLNANLHYQLIMLDINM